MTARLDSEFLDDVGLGALPEEAKGDLLQRIYSELDERVGERLTRGMSPMGFEEKMTKKEDAEKAATAA